MVGVGDVDWLLEPRFGRLLDNLAASPGAFTAARVFGVLNSGAREDIKPEGGGTVWPSPDAPIDFSATLDGLAALTARGLIPFVALGLFPRAISPSPIAPPASFDGWRRLVRAFLDRLVADPRFGAAAIGDWWFEVWNEPNDPRFWSGTFAQYLDLYRATSETVLETGLPLRLGGPAITHHPAATPTGPAAMAAFLRFLTAEPAVKCDFLSFHRKGTFGPEQPELARLVTAAVDTATAALAIDAGRFTGVPVVNDEADMKLGFEVPYEPRMDETFPAWLSAVMIAHDALASRFADQGVRFLAASDNAAQHLVQAPFDGRRSIMTRASSSPRDLLKLPVYNFYELLRLLGDRHGTFVAGGDRSFPNSELFHLITVAAGHLGSLFAIYPRSSAETPRAWAVDYTITDIPWPRINVARFRIDRTHSNAYTAAGRTLGRPIPDATAADIRLAQELTVDTPIRRDLTLADATFRDTFSLDPFGVLAYWLTPFTPNPPAAPVWLEATPEDGNVVLRWTPNREPFFYSYELYLMREGAPTALLSPTPLRAALWVDTGPPRGQRVYGVRAVTASGVASPIVLSDPVTL